MNRQNSNQLQQQQTSSQQFMSSEQTHQQQQFSQQRISRSEQTVTRQVTQQRVQHGMLQTTTPTQLFSPLPGQLASDSSPPVFEQIFKNARFAQGGDAFFEGKLRGNPVPEVSWTRKGAPLLQSAKHHMSYNPTTGDVSLLIKQIGPGDEGEYTCKVKNAVGEAICSVFIQSEGQPMPQFQQLNHTQQQQNSQYTNGYSHTTIETEFKVDIFEYRLLREVSFRESITRRYANESDYQLSTIVDPKLGPPAPPQVGQKPRNSKLVEGSDAVFMTKVSSNPKPRLTWFHNGQRITNTEKHETTYSNNQAMLRIKSASSTDSGHYTMLAENTQGVIVSSAVLAIEPAQERPAQTPQPDAYVESADSSKTLGPSFVRIFQDTTTTEGKLARFDCRLTGRPYPDVTWFINGRPVQDDATHKILVNESGNHSLMITNVNRSDGGVVTCLARNKGGEVNIQARLNVLEKEQVVAPKFVERFTTVNVKEDEHVALHARVVGTPAPRISWQKDGVPLVPTADINISIVDGVTTLDILRAKASDAAWYQCTAQNVAGSTATRARIFVETPKTPVPSEQRRLYLPRPTKVIEPEPPQEPEIIYLKHVERAKPYTRPGEDDRVYPPPQFIVPLTDITQFEGGKVHFETRIEPVGDPTMWVEWYLNGQLIQASSRTTATFKFGFIALDLMSIVGHDSGEYVCRVSSSTGVVESRAILRVKPRPSIESQTQHPTSLEYIQNLEDYSRYQRTESIEESINQKPQFIRPLHQLGDLEEGRNAHFEAQLTPVSDPSMRVEWYKDGRPITASSRITAIFNFGYVSLNILHLRAEDAGSYTVRAVNRMGEAISTSSIRVISKSGVTSELGIAEQQKYIEKTEELEAYQRYQHTKFVEETPDSVQRPEFRNPIKDQLNIREGGFAHFEARLEPVGDSTLRVEWLKNGRAVEASSRITAFFNFGYVALTIKQVTIHDLGTYTCRAYNAVGEAHTTAELTVVSKKDVLVDTQHPSGLEKIQHLEDSSKTTMSRQEEVIVTDAPRFLGPLKGTSKICEGQRAHFEARVEPQSDLSMTIAWYHNGQPITAANRIQTYHDFGYVALDILNVREEDAGEYTVVARNNLGEAFVQSKMFVETRSGIDTSSMHRGIHEKTQKMENKQHIEPQYNIEELCRAKPSFVIPLSDPKPVTEGKNIHLECRLEPLGDPTMRVEWFQNGRPITIGSRFRTYNDFGYVALDIIHASTMDSGEYTVRATNQLGSAHTSSCVRVIGRSDIVTDTQNEMSLEQIQYLEDASKIRREVQEDITIMSAPQFTRSLHNIETVEGTNVHLECRLQPVGDPSMRVEWYVNGFPVKTGHRFRPAHDFDYVALDLLGVYAVDSGVYTCQARNSLGEAVTSCSVRVIAKKDLILESQYPAGLEKIQYLEDSSRYRRNEYVDEIINIKPKFVTKPKNLENMREGQHAHFECKLEPVTDSNLKVEWYKNGRPITIGHRFRPIHDFGYVALDVIDCISEDTGTYTCRAVNLVGSDEIHCSLVCRGTIQIVTETQNEVGLEQIQYLEDRSKYSRTELTEETTKQTPVFTTSLKNVDIKESQRAHFECRLIPVSDPTMKVEWYHNNVPVKSGSRFTETNNFGFVALDIMSCMPEDSGSYTCRAVNALGEAVTSATASIQSKKSIYLESQHVEALQHLRVLEDSSRYQRTTATEEIVTQAPVFTMPVRDSKVLENQPVHFEARLIPVGDPKLKVEWLRNGILIEASNRITTMHDFGYVALNMKYVNPEDSGTYTCRAVNDLGQAVTSATLIVQSKAALDLETQNENALEKIHQLEDSTKYSRREEEDINVTQAPRFTTKLVGPTSLVEGQSAHYECRIEPYPDPNLKVEWFHNGKPLSTGHRYRTTNDFGFAALDVLSVYEADSGEYTCRATNRLGQATAAVKLNVTSRSSIIRDTQHEGALEKIQYLEDGSRLKRREEDEHLVAEKPQFGRPLRNASVAEGSPVHLEATLTPVNDPTMKVEWFCNGLPIPQGHRFKTTYDFGFVALDILYAHAEDTGTYMCKAKNAAGEAATTCAVKVTGNAGLYLDTLDEDRLKKIRELENYEKPRAAVEEPAGQKPVFLTPLVSLENLKEGDHAHLECRVEPINDPNLKIEWFINGKAIRAGHRFRTTHDFGYVALDVLYVYGEDTGNYMCKATNRLGEAMNTCNIRVINRRSIILDTQHPDGLEKIQKLEAKSGISRLEVEDLPLSPPRFVTELRGTTDLCEGQTAHFEAQVEPIHDPNLRIEFYHNGKPLGSASRFHITFDFGYVSLDIQHVVPEDAGEYMLKAINALGQCKSQINMRVTAKSGIILDSQRPEGLDKIRQLESAQPFQRPDIPEAVTRQRPVFTQPLQNIDAIAEGTTAHFECRLIPVGDPNLKVEWFRNEKPIEESSRITSTHDFGYVSMDITHIRDEDEGVYMCRATNPLGEAVTTASMRVRTKASIQLETQHPEGMRKIAQLEQPLQPRGEDAERTFEKPIFTQLLTGPHELWEGQHAHFEARVVPVGDPSLRYEWYVNGVELKMGSRFRTTHDFGFVTLDINSTTTEDSGVYMCKAINNAGEAVSSTSMKVKPKSSIVGDTLLPESWEKIRLKEAAMNKVPEMFVDTSPQQAPVFTTHLQSFDKLTEGQHVYLEAQVEPRADPNLRIEWFKNGVALTTGSRIRSTFDFGLVTLSVNSLRADDSDIYTCKATNLLGEAVSTCTLKVEDRHWLLGDTMHPDALQRIGDLEAPRGDRPDAPEIAYESPVFISHLNNVECKEGDNAHFECKVEPSKDPTMQIEWFVNGQPLPVGARFKSTYDFGYVALDIAGCYAEDSGIYTCKATNNKGNASTSGSLRCTSGTTMFLDTQHPQGKAGLEAVQQREDDLANKYKRQDSKPEKDYGKPIWTVPLAPEFKLGEAEPLHLEGQVEPKDDPNLKIEWYFNGKVLEHGARFKMTNDFGFVTLDLTEAYERDQGIYTCKASNKSGEAFTTTTIFCTSKDNLIERTQHPKGAEGLGKIQDLEESLRRGDGKPVESDEGHAPKFTSEFTSLYNVSEGEVAHFEASLIPTGDQTMVIEWFHNGKQMDASHRFRTVYAFGMVVLEVLGTKIEDSGAYSCRATNKWGTAEISLELECVDKSAGQKPRFTTQIQNLDGLKDGQSAHFECTLVPVGDPLMKVEWFHNGKPMRHSNRIKPVSDFGYVLLDISYVQSHDSGEYMCRASNKYGEDFTRATLKCFGKSGVYLDTLQPDSLARIRELESQYGQQPAMPGSPVGEPPKFTTQISDVTKLVEGQSAHFEGRLTPVNDPELIVEWYFNGKKLPHGHRYRTFHDFGIVILDILYCYEENSGEFECRATNKYGSDSTKAQLKCVSKANLILDSQLPRGMEGGLEKIQTLEDSHLRDTDDKVSEKTGKAPVFTVPLSNIDALREGENSHFEARLTPTDDPKLKVEWFWNGKPLKAGSRFRTFCDFGFVILEISPVYPEDTGEYSCRASNDYGEAVTTCTMKVQGKRSIILESQLPKGMEGTIDKIAELEGLGMGPTQMSPDDESGKPPEFITSPTDLTLTENSLAHFECRLTPINDPSMRVEWYHNGKALWAGSRIKTINDFGFVILELSGCYQRDSGLYTCKATNKHGEASVSCKLQVRGRQGIIMEPQLPVNFRTGTESIQKLEESLHKREEIQTDDEKPNPPRFVVEVKDNIDIPEGGPVHFDCRVEPANDSTLRIDWFHNGRPFATGSRVHMLNDFGFIALDMDYAYARDSGIYECRATNKWGSASTIAKVTCKSRTNIILDSQLPEGMTAEKLKELERGPTTEAPKEDKVFGPPKFITQIQSATVDESDSIRFECRVEPKDDPRLRIEWYRNGKSLPSGHRYRTIYDMGFISLDILYVYAEDSGEYVCKAINEHGSDTTKAFITCKKLPSIILQNQIPKGMQKSETLMQMEATIKKYTSEIFLTEDDLFDPDRKQPPRFVTQILDQTKLVEMESTKFECQLAPVGDPNMKVEWFFNGKPLSFKNRFTPIYDFGYVAMNFGWVYPEDSGEYVCRATNLYGMDETRAIIKTAGKPGIIYDSQLPKGMKSIEKIREMEALWSQVPEAHDDDIKPKQAPIFVSKPEPCTAEEGEWARFQCRVTGHPKPRVMWLINGHTVVNGQRYKLNYDGMYHFDVPKTRQYDTGKIEVIARNSAGEALATTSLEVVERRDDYRGVLKNSPRQIVGTKDYRKPEWVEHMEEMQEALAAAYMAPAVILECKDSRAMEGENGFFDCTVAGNPKPVITWYFNGVVLVASEKYIMNVTEEYDVYQNVKFTASLKIIEITLADYGYYVCRATVAETFTESRAKLVESSTAQTVYVVEEVKEVPFAEEVASLNFTQILGKKKGGRTRQSKKEEFVSEHLITSKGHQSSSNVTEQTEEVITETIIHHVTHIQGGSSTTTQTSVKIKTEDEVIVQEVQADASVKELQHKTVTSTINVGNISQLKNSSEVNQFLSKIQINNFKHGSGTLRELATIAYLIQSGMGETDIISLYNCNNFPALHSPVAQSAMVQLLEREGHGTLVTEVLTETTDIDETTMASQAGFRAFMRMIQIKHTKIEEILTHFSPDDFVIQDWMIDESGEKLITTMTSSEIEIIEPVVVDMQNIAQTSKEMQPHIAADKSMKRRSKSVKTKSKRTDTDTEQTAEITETQTQVIIKRKLLLETKQESIDQDHIPLETTEILLPLDVPAKQKQLTLDIAAELSEVVPISMPVNVEPLPYETIQGTTNSRPIQTAVSEQVVTYDRESEQAPTFNQSRLETRSTIELGQLNKSLIITETKSEEISEQRISVTEQRPEPAAVNFLPSQTVQTEETVTYESYDTMSQTKNAESVAKTNVDIQNATVITEVSAVHQEIQMPDYVKPLEMIPLQVLPIKESVEISEINRTEAEATMKPFVMPQTEAIDFDYQKLESIETNEIIANDVPNKFYPEIIVPTEKASTRLIEHKSLVTQETNATETEDVYRGVKSLATQKASVVVSTSESLQVENVNVEETDQPLDITERPAEQKATDIIPTLQSLTTDIVNSQFAPNEFHAELPKAKEAEITISENVSLVSEVCTTMDDLKAFDTKDRNYAKTSATLTPSHKIPETFEAELHEKEESVAVQPRESGQALVELELFEAKIVEEPQSMTATAEHEPISAKVASATAEVLESKSTEVTSTMVHESVDDYVSTLDKTPAIAKNLYEANPTATVTSDQIMEQEDEFVPTLKPELQNVKLSTSDTLKSRITEEVQFSENTSELKKHEELRVTAKQGLENVNEKIISQDYVFETTLDYDQNAMPAGQNIAPKTDRVDKMGLIVTEILPEDQVKTETYDFETKVASTDIVPHYAPLSTENVTMDQTSTTAILELNQREATFLQSEFESIIVTDRTVQETEKPFEANARPTGTIAQPIYESLKSLAQSEIFAVESSEQFAGSDLANQTTGQSNVHDTDAFKTSVTEVVQLSEVAQKMEMPERNVSLAKPDVEGSNEKIVSQNYIFESVADYSSEVLPAEKSVAPYADQVENVGLIVTEVYPKDQEKSLDYEYESKLASSDIVPHHAPISYETQLLQQTADTEASELNLRNALPIQSTLESLVVLDNPVQEAEQPFEGQPKLTGNTALTNYESLKSLAQSEIYSIEASQDFTSETFKATSTGQSQIHNSDAFKSHVTEVVQLSELTTRMESPDHTTSSAHIQLDSGIEKVVTEQYVYEHAHDYVSDVIPAQQTTIPRSDKVENQGVVVTEIVSSDREKLDEPFTPDTKKATADVTPYHATMAAENVVIDQTTLVEKQEFKQKKASVSRDLHESIIVSDQRIQESETAYEAGDKLAEHTAHAEYKPLESVGQTEVVLLETSQNIEDKVTVTSSSVKQIHDTDTFKTPMTEEVMLTEHTEKYESPQAQTSAANVQLDSVNEKLVSQDYLLESVGEYVQKALPSQQSITAKSEPVENLGVIITEVHPADNEKDVQYDYKPLTATPNVSSQHVPLSTETILLDQITDSLDQVLNKTTASIGQTQFESMIVTESTVQEAEQPFDNVLKLAEKSAIPSYEPLKSMTSSQVHPIESSEILEDSKTKPSEAETVIHGFDACKSHITEEVQVSELSNKLDQPQLVTSVAKVEIENLTNQITSEDYAFESTQEYTGHLILSENLPNVISDQPENMGIVVTEVVTEDREKSVSFDYKTSTAAPQISEQRVPLSFENVPLEQTDVSMQEKLSQKSAVVTQTPYESITIVQDIVHEKEQVLDGFHKPLETTATEGGRSTMKSVTQTEVYAIETPESMTTTSDIQGLVIDSSVYAPDTLKTHVTEEVLTSESTRRINDFDKSDAFANLAVDSANETVISQELAFESVGEYTTNEVLEKKPTQRVDNVENLGLIVTQIIPADLEKTEVFVSSDVSKAAPGVEPHRAPVSFQNVTLDQTSDSPLMDTLKLKTATLTQTPHENLVVTDTTVHEGEGTFERPTEIVEKTALASFQTLKSVAQAEVISMETSQKLSEEISNIESTVQSTIDNEVNKFYVTEEVQPSESFGDTQIRPSDPCGSAVVVPYEHTQVMVEKVQTQEKEGSLAEFMVQSGKTANFHIETFESILKSEVITSDTIEPLADLKVEGQETQPNTYTEKMFAPIVQEVMSSESTGHHKDLEEVFKTTAKSTFEVLPTANISEVQPQENVSETMTEIQNKQTASMVVDSLKVSVSTSQVQSSENITDIVESTSKQQIATKTYAKINESIQSSNIIVNENETQISEAEIDCKKATPNIRDDLFSTASISQPQTHERENTTTDMIYLDLQQADTKLKTLELPLATEVFLSENLSDLSLVDQPPLNVAKPKQTDNLILAENTEIIPDEHASVLKDTCNCYDC